MTSSPADPAALPAEPAADRATDRLATSATPPRRAPTDPEAGHRRSSATPAAMVAALLSFASGILALGISGRSFALAFAVLLVGAAVSAMLVHRLVERRISHEFRLSPTAAGEPRAALAATAAAADDPAARLAALEAATAMLRHDIRGLLSPALLCGDRLSESGDPAVRRAGEIIVRTVDRVTDRLNETRTAAPGFTAAGSVAAERPPEQPSNRALPSGEIDATT